MLRSALLCPAVLPCGVLLFAVTQHASCCAVGPMKQLTGSSLACTTPADHPQEFFQGGEVWKENEEWRQQQAALRRSGPGRPASGSSAAADAEQQQLQQQGGGS